MESLGRDRDLNIENFKIFCENLLSVAVGRRKFKEGQCTKRISKFCTISNEAFIIISVENSYDRWKWEWTKKQAAGAAHGHMPPKKYTQNPSAAKKYRGWSAEGIARYFQLIKEVKLARKDKDRKSLEEQYLANAMTARNAGGGRKRKVDVMEDPNEDNLVLRVEHDSDTEEEDSDDEDDSEERERGGGMPTRQQQQQRGRDAHSQGLFLPGREPPTTYQLTGV